jgi:hypothetical protein
MSSHRAVYHGYSIHTWLERGQWSVRAEPFDAGSPILSRRLYEGLDSRGAALQTIKREIDRLLSVI